MRKPFVLAGILMIGAFVVGMVSCASKKEEGKGVINLRWVSDPNPARKEQIALFEKVYPGIKVNLDWSSSGLEKVLIQAAGGNPPDLIDVHSRAIFNIFSEKEMLFDITDYCEKYNVDLEDFWPQCKPRMEYQSRIYTFPANASVHVLFYNKRLFDEAGISYPDETWTWKDMLEAAKKLTKIDSMAKTYKQFGIVWDRLDILIWQNGGSKYTPDGKRCIINSPEAKEAVRFLYDLRFKHHVMPTQSEMQSLASAAGWGQGGINLFSGGSIAMYPCGRWAIVQFRKCKGLDWDIAPLPRGKEKVSLFLTRTTAISRACRYPEEAFKFLLFLRSKEYNELISCSGDSLPACMSIAKSDVFLYDPTHPRETNNQLYLDEMEYARSREISPYVSDLEVRRIEKEEYDLMWAGVQTPEETLENIAEKINVSIAKNLQ